jgi:Ca2+-binding RTX toxin-like protein
MALIDASKVASCLRRPALFRRRQAASDAPDRSAICAGDDESMTKTPEAPRKLTEEEVNTVSGGAITELFAWDNDESNRWLNTNGNDSLVAIARNMHGDDFDFRISVSSAEGETGDDTIVGRQYRDTIDGGGGNNLLDGGAGNDVITARDGADTILGGEGADVIDSGAGDDRINGGTWADQIAAGAGNDQVWWQRGDGDDTINGGNGVDTIVLNIPGMTLMDVFRSVVPGWRSSAQIEGDRIRVSGDGSLVIGSERISYSQVEYIALPATLAGSEASDVLQGTTNSQVLRGGGGDDVLIGAHGHDTIEGGAGDDLAIWRPGDGSDSVDGGTGTDTLRLDRMDITPQQLLDAIRVDPGSRQPTLTADGRVDVTGVTGRVVLAGATIDFRNLDYIEGPRVTGTAGADNLSGSAVGDNIVGGAGGDTIIAGYGNDTVYGQDGDDVIVWRPNEGSDSIDGGMGTDTLRLDESRYSIADLLRQIVPDAGSRPPMMTDDGRIYVQGVSGSITIDGQVLRFSNLEYIEVPKLVGTDRAEIITGTTGGEIIDAGAGDDTIIGGGGHDTIAAGGGQDLIVWASGDGRDSIDGGTGVDTLRIEDTGLSGAQLRDLIVPDTGVAPPRLLADGSIQVMGPGSVTINGETLRFTNIDFIVTGSYTWYAGRTG